MHTYITGILFNIFEIVLFIIGAYWLAISVFSIFPVRNTAKSSQMNKFAVVIPAHNEAKVIPALIGSIKDCDYPNELIHVLVVADGCTDSTAETALQCGAAVIKKDMATNKGDALRAAFEHLRSFNCDCIAVFDSDNIIDNGFFREMNEHLAIGSDAIQGYIDSKNHNASWVANAHSIWYWLTNRIIQSGRAKLNLGCRLGGTGFVLRKSLLDKIPWKTETLAEDAEYTALLAYSGIKVDYAERAVVYDEKPTGFSQSVMQRKRWAQGIRDVQGEYTSKLLMKGNFNAIMGLWSDFLYPLCFVLLFLLAVLSPGGIFSSTVGKAVLWFYIAASIVTSIIALMLDKKLNHRTFLNFFGFILYMLSWIPVGFFGIFGQNNKDWHHTRHGDK